MELLSRGVSYPYNSVEEALAIEHIINGFDIQYTSSIASMSAVSEDGARKIMDSLGDLIYPEGKFKKAEKLKAFEESFKRIRQLGPLKIKPS